MLKGGPASSLETGIKEKKKMYIDRMLRIIAGFFILGSLTLAHFHSPNWLWFTAFVGLNLFQSGFSNWCPMITILEKAGMPKFPRECAGK